MTTLVETLGKTGTQGAFGASGAETSIVARLVDWIAEHRRYRRTLSELSTLSDRELDDIGLSRGEVEIVARRSARSA
jgi:uncharacterized protein YjiS (DUF1127 family)